MAELGCHSLCPQEGKIPACMEGGLRPLLAHGECIRPSFFPFLGKAQTDPFAEAHEFWRDLGGKQARCEKIEF